jgi:hypothetical protein
MDDTHFDSPAKRLKEPTIAAFVSSTGCGCRFVETTGRAARKAPVY